MLKSRQGFDSGMVNRGLKIFPFELFLAENSSRHVSEFRADDEG